MKEKERKSNERESMGEKINEDEASPFEQAIVWNK